MEQGTGSSKDKGKGKLKTLDPWCWRCEAWDLVCEMLVGGKSTFCKECKAVKGCCERPGEERVPKRKRKVVEEQDQPQKKQRSEDVLELGSVHPRGMPDWTKLFRGIVDAIKSLEATVKVQNQHLHHQHLRRSNPPQGRGYLWGGFAGGFRGSPGCGDGGGNGFGGQAEGSSESRNKRGVG